MIPWEFRVTQGDGLNLASDRGDKRGWGWLGGFQFNEIARPPQPTIRKEGPAGFGGRGFWGFGVKFGVKFVRGVQPAPVLWGNTLPGVSQ